MKLYFTKTEKEFKELIKTSSSFRQVILKLGYREHSDLYRILRNQVRALKIDVSHFTGRGWSKGLLLGRERTIYDYLTKDGIRIASHQLKLRLIEEKIFSAICSNCKNIEWLSHPIPLELDHINGNNRDNRLENLRLLCPNCHALTPTYRAKNMKQFRRTIK